MVPIQGEVREVRRAEQSDRCTAELERGEPGDGLARATWVFRDGKAMSEAMRLLNAKVNDDLLYSPLLSCVVPCGTKVVVTDGGFMHSTVLGD